MKISAINNINYKANLKNNKNTTAPNFKNDVVEISSKNISFGSGFELGLKLKGMLYARKADKILAQAKQVRLSQYEVIEDAQELQKEAGILKAGALQIFLEAFNLLQVADFSTSGTRYDEDGQYREYIKQDNCLIIRELDDEDDCIMKEIKADDKDIVVTIFDTSISKDNAYTFDRKTGALKQFEYGISDISAHKAKKQFLFDHRGRLERVSINYKKTSEWEVSADKRYTFEYNGELLQYDYKYFIDGMDNREIKQRSKFDEFGLTEIVFDIKDLPDLKEKYSSKYTYNHDRTLNSYSKSGMINKFEDEQNPQKFQFVDNKLLDVFENMVTHRDSSAESDRVFRYENGEAVQCLLEYDLTCAGFEKANKTISL